MLGIITANVVMLLLASGIASGIMPPRTLGGALAILHKTVGITLPEPGKERSVAVLWVVSMIAIGDAMLFLLLLLTKSVFRV
jgi:hypothetical protein